MKKIKQIPKEITLGKLEVIIIPNGELLCLGKRIGWFKDFKDCLEVIGTEEK